VDVVHERAVGTDISKRDAKVCVREPGKHGTVHIDSDDVGFDDA
jgi:hypothetical protein